MMTADETETKPHLQLHRLSGFALVPSRADDINQVFWPVHPVGNILVYPGPELGNQSWVLQEPFLRALQN